MMLAIAVCARCPAHADPVTKIPLGRPVYPPQVTDWQPLANFARQYIGNKLSIKKNTIDFSAAGRFYVQYAGRYHDGRLYKVIEAHVPHGQSNGLICRSKLTYLAINPGEIKIIKDKTLTFVAFSGTAKPVWHSKNSDVSSFNCGQFTYGAPLKH
ncbi:hypothetical protein [Acidiphilium acidophilum]|uniref:Uncharacterized protein n=1 Tax=Acidiphilium acidophilum TaxID=76588 RepID=A0AAW9DQI3_ACIAO|nr:hypothetical protein [Acidiphilium acidophilum]MDX5930485.1 hypothetical protein [Acidiphilium acidophilum]